MNHHKRVSVSSSCSASVPAGRRRASSTAHAPNRSVNPPPGLAHGTGTVPTPCTGHVTRGTPARMNALYRKKPGCRHTRSRLPSPASRKSTDPTFQRRPQLQDSGEQVRGIHATNLPDRHHHPPQTAKGLYVVHIVRSLRNLWNWNLRTRNSRNQSAVISSLESMSKSDMANERIAGSSYVFM